MKIAYCSMHKKQCWKIPSREISGDHRTILYSLWIMRFLMDWKYKPKLFYVENVEQFALLWSECFTGRQIADVPRISLN